MKKQICMMMAAMMASAALTGCSGGAKETSTATAASNGRDNAGTRRRRQRQKQRVSAGDPRQSRQAIPQRLSVAAAASLKNAYEDELIPTFQEYPGRGCEGYL